MTLCCHRSHGTAKCEGNSRNPSPFIIEKCISKLKSDNIKYKISTYFVYFVLRLKEESFEMIFLLNSLFPKKILLVLYLINVAYALSNFNLQLRDNQGNVCGK
jgi:hypothetical protein